MVTNKTRIFLVLLTILCCLRASAQVNAPIVLAYFPSWSESWVTGGQDSPLRRIPSYVNYVFLAFAKPNLTYTAGSYDISGTGLEVPYDGCALKESVSALKNKGVKVILSIGGETYWNSPNVYAGINYNAIKALVDDMGFAGIDWDYEPDGSFTNIGNATNVQHFIDFINNSRAIMPASQGYLIACAPSGVGALGGQTNNDTDSPYRFEARNTLTGETDANLYNGSAATNGINLFGFSATGHMIPVFESVGDKIDIVAFQGYNCGGSTNRSIMYDAYAHYAETYGFHVVAGTHFPNEPWGPFYTYTHQNIASLAAHIRDYPSRVGDNDGVMIWQLLLTATGSSAYSYLNVASQVLGGTAQSTAIANANNFATQPYTGGAQGCGSGQGATLYCGYAAYNPASNYPTAGTRVYYQCKIWKSQWWANAGEAPGANPVWVVDSNCGQGPGCACNGVANGSIIAVSSCGPYTSPGGLHWNTSGTYRDTLTNAAGCDSILTVNLTVNGTVATVSETNNVLKALPAGGAYQWFKCVGNGFTPLAGQTQVTYAPSVAGSYAVRVTKNGCMDTSLCHAFSLCDGAVPVSNIQATACGVYVSPSGKSWTATGVYHDTVSTAAGCDSVVTVNLTINGTVATVSETNNVLKALPAGGIYQWFKCTGNGFTPLAGQTQVTYTPSVAGSYAVRVTKNGCMDTSLCHAFSLCDGAVPVSGIQATACGVYVSPSGKSWTATGVYHDTVSTAAGCDSVVTVNLIVHTVAASVNVSGNTMTASPATTYQWLNCANANAPIAGATAQTYLPTATGSYAVAVTQNGCSDTSACTDFSLMGMDEWQEQGLAIYPNPTVDGSFWIRWPAAGKLYVTVTNAAGQMVFARSYTESLPHVTLNAAAGIYLVTVTDQNGRRFYARLAHQP